MASRKSASKNYKKGPTLSPIPTASGGSNFQLGQNTNANGAPGMGGAPGSGKAGVGAIGDTSGIPSIAR